MRRYLLFFISFIMIASGNNPVLPTSTMHNRASKFFTELKNTGGEIKTFCVDMVSGHPYVTSALLAVCLNAIFYCTGNTPTLNDIGTHVNEHKITYGVLIVGGGLDIGFHGTNSLPLQAPVTTGHYLKVYSQNSNGDFIIKLIRKEI